MLRRIQSCEDLSVTPATVWRMDRGGQGQTGGHLRSSRVSEGAMMESWKERKRGTCKDVANMGRFRKWRLPPVDQPLGVKEVCYKGDSWM